MGDWALALLIGYTLDLLIGDPEWWNAVWNTMVFAFFSVSIETVLGAARLAALSEEPASALRARVTSKGGTAEAALRVMTDSGLKEAIVAGVKAANARGGDLGELLGKD